MHIYQIGNIIKFLVLGDDLWIKKFLMQIKK